ncbi:MAG: L,D-transpeptidase [Acidobacteriota bacterium]|nr:L,D-transpeptidase [Acidobacteriota bacterium]
MRRKFQTVLLVILLVGALCPGAAVVGQESDGALVLVVRKEARELRVLSGSEVIATYPIGLGFQPKGDKQREGDGATPEGRYSVCIKNPQSRYYLSLGINYPSAKDAERALAEGWFSREEARAILEAERDGRCPPWDTPLGGEIYIHGRGSSADWTLGCIALDDPDMKALYDRVKIGTEVRIEP